MVIRCIECEERISPKEQAHDVHSDVDCTLMAGLCRCYVTYAHARCCRACKPPAAVPGQVEAFPMASTSGVVKRRTS